MIDLKSVRRTFGKLVALDDVSLTLEQGDVFGYIGPNGAGKSTTMKILACLLRADSGTAHVAGHNCETDGDQIRRLLGYMPDFLGVYPDLRVDEYLEFFAAAYHIPRRDRKRVVSDVLELTDLIGKRSAMVDSLSRGMKQRLGVARVLIHDPQVLLLDEPASGLDPRARIEMRSLLLELRRMGKTIMISSHILSELHEMCNKIGIIERGKLLFTGTIDEAIAQSGLHGNIDLIVDDPMRAESVLSSIESVERVRRENGMITVSLASDDLKPRIITEALVREGIGVDSLQPRQVKLEDVFLALTRGEVM